MRTRILLKRLLLIIAVLMLLTPMVFGHSGRTDKNGGHTDHKTGEYHYHNGSCSPTK